MKRSAGLGVLVMALAGCGGGNSEAVGANSSESVPVTAEGNIVGTVPAATPTAEATAEPAPEETATPDAGAQTAAPDDATVANQTD